MKRFVIAAVLAIAAMSGCSNDKAEAGYQGKADLHPWDSPEAGGAKAQWEERIQTRTRNQNEYARIR